MGMTAFVFPGQGSQYIGMGKDFYETYEAARRVYGLAAEVTGLDVAGICFSENEKINITEFTQIAIAATEAAILAVVTEAGIRADCCAGLSLGEYGALLAAGVIEQAELFGLVKKRGIYMRQAYPEGGAMTAVLGLDADVVGKVCLETEGDVFFAGDNCPSQTVISGERRAVKAAEAELLKEGAAKCVPLKVSGPFHTPLLAEAAEKLASQLDKIKLCDPKIPYVCNVEADYVRDARDLTDLLARHITCPVRWRESMERMIADGVDTFVEIGPGGALRSFLKKIDADVKVFNVETAGDLERLKREA